MPSVRSCFKGPQAFLNMEDHGLHPEQKRGLEDAVASAYFPFPPVSSPRTHHGWDELRGEWQAGLGAGVCGLVAQTSWKRAEAIQKFGGRCESHQLFSVA